MTSNEVPTFETSPIQSPSRRKISLEEEKEFESMAKLQGDNMSLDAVSLSSEDEANEEPEDEIKLYQKDIENKSSEEILNYLKNTLGIEEGEDHLIREAIVKGKAPRKGKIRWIWG